MCRHETSSEGVRTKQTFTLGVFHAVISHAVNSALSRNWTVFDSTSSSESFQSVNNVDLYYIIHK